MVFDQFLLVADEQKDDSNTSGVASALQTLYLWSLLVNVVQYSAVFFITLYVQSEAESIFPAGFC